MPRIKDFIRPFPLVAFTTLGLVSLSASSLTLAAYAADQLPAQQEIVSLIQKIKTVATEEIIALHGQSKLDLLEKAISSRYPPSQFPPSAHDGSCPGFGPSGEANAQVIEAKILDKSGVYFVVGAEAVLKGIPEVAKWAFANAASLSPMCPLHLANLAFVLNGEGDYKTAILLLDFAKFLDPKLSTIYVNLAFSYQNLKRYDDAIRAYLIAIAINPQITKYQQMLLAVQKMKEKSKPVVTSDRGRKETPKTADLDQALKLVEEKKKKEMDQDLSRHTPKSTPAPRGEDRVSSTRPRGSGRPGVTQSPKAVDSMNIFMADFASILQRAIEDCELGAKRAKEDAAKFQPGSTPHVIREVAATANLMMALLFRGYLNEITGEWLQSDVSDWFAREAIKDLAKLEKLGQEPKSGLKHKVYLGPIGIEEDFDGTFKLEVSAGIIGAEFKYNPKTLNFGVKASFGPQYEFGIGPLGASAEAEAYFEADLDQGPVVGLKTKLLAGVTWAKIREPGGGESSFIPTKLESEIDVVRPTELSKLSFENLFK